MLEGSCNNVGPKLCSVGGVPMIYKRNTIGRILKINFDWTVITLHYWASALCITVHTGQSGGGGNPAGFAQTWTVICSHQPRF